MASNIHRHAPCWTEEIIVTTHLRIAAGACALSLGLLVCGSGAAALADGTDPVGSPTGAQAGTIAGGQGATEPPTSTIGNQRVDEEPGQDVTTPTTSGDTPTVGEGPTSTVEAQTYSSDEKKDEGTGKGESKPGDEAGTTPSTESITPMSESAPPASESNIAPPAPTVPASDASPPAPAPTLAAAPVPPPPPVTVTTTVVSPVPNSFATLARALGTVSATLAALPTSKTPVTDVIKMLNAVADAGVALAQMPSDLYSLLGVPPGVQRSLIGGGGALHPARTAENAPLIGPQASQLPRMPAVPKNAPLFGTVVHASNVGGVATTGLEQALALSGLAPVPAGVKPATRSFLDNVVSSVLAPVSLTALAAIAVPGLGGLLIVCAAGVRIGYRQAKAGLAVRVAGIARFAGPGPLGVVRSGSLITLYPRTARADRLRAARTVRAETADATRQLEKVA